MIDTSASPATQVRLHLDLDGQCRALARVIALIEGRGMQVGDLRFWPPSSRRATAEAVIDVGCSDAGGAERALATLIGRIEGLPSVRGCTVEARVAA